jgi:hypothetical protein
MKRMMLAALITVFAAGSAGRRLAGAARNSFMAKCKNNA